MLQQNPRLIKSRGQQLQLHNHQATQALIQPRRTQRTQPIRRTQPNVPYSYPQQHINRLHGCRRTSRPANQDPTHNQLLSQTTSPKVIQARVRNPEPHHAPQPPSSQPCQFPYCLTHRNLQIQNTRGTQSHSRKRASQRQLTRQQAT